MQNLWNELCDRNAVEYLRLVGVNEKYIDGSASDFEKLYVLCRSLENSEDNLTAGNIAAKISELTGKKVSVADVARADAAQLWTEYNKIKYHCAMCGERYNTALFSISSLYCDEDCRKPLKIINPKDLSADAENSLVYAQDVCVYAEFFGSEFRRPNAYSASAELKKRSADERYDRDIVLCQRIFERAYKNQSKKIQLLVHSHGGEEYISELVKYAILRKASMRIFAVADGTLSPLQIKSICLLGSNDCFVTPTICEKLWRSKRSIEEYTAELSRIYPRARVGFLKYKFT